MEQIGRTSRTETRLAKQALRRFIEEQIASEAWPPGAQLPTERALATQFETARNTVRRALAELEASGRIVRHVGRGTFVCEPERPVEPANDADSRSINPAEIMEVRLVIEPAMVDLIVARASQIELEELQEIVDKGGAAPSQAEFELWDAKLHNALVHASKNAYLARILAGVHAVRQMTAWGQLKRRGMTEERRAAYQIEHQAIVSALLDRDAERAREAVAAHLKHVRDSLIGV